ncbi:Golgi apparatus membrane protein TVP23 A [Apophysomyces ossiformis]|uniref:Golgi apparatus membrane protein TVP23 n=1 Tax=Apophysomyces ossiformis TaxID=679940 RepID=A0A8H7BMK1_9FUNG|nr:Golgi apparatus membrane protein TVP23 A [Apophysomyces ossiformis]
MINFTLIFVITILLLAFDFWTVKNVSGRLLVGLRWWNEIQEDGSNRWVFESANVSFKKTKEKDLAMIAIGIDPNYAQPNRQNNPADSRLFWTVLYVTPAIWVLLALACLIGFNPSWLVIVAVAIVLNMANVIGYTQCDKDAKRKWAGNAAQSALGTLGGNATGLVGKVFSSGLGKFF